MIDLRDDKPLWGLGEVLRVSWPASLSMLNGTILQFVDALMVSSRGPSALAAQFIGGISAFVPISLALGMLTVVNTYVSQNLGAGRPHRCGRYAWAGLAVAAGYCLLLMPPLLALAGRLFALFGHGTDITAMETMYFRYMMSAAVLFLGSRVLEQFFFGIHRPGIVLIATILCNVANVGLNYVLIFGKLGFPALGLQGAAIGTVASTVLRFGLLMGVFLSGRLHARFATRAVRTTRWSHCRELVRVGWPAGVRFSNDTLTWTLFNAALVGRFGRAHLEASTIAARYMSLSFMPAVGVGIATTALVGRHIGAGRADLARRRAHAAVAAAMAYMGLCGLAFLIFRHEMVNLFVTIPDAANMTAEQVAARRGLIVAIGGRIMVCAAVFQLFDALNIVFVGALRGAGDTFWPMVATAALSWSVTVGGGIAMVHFLPQLTSIGPWLAASAYVVVLGLLMAWRFESGAWRKIDLLGRRARLDEPGGC